MCWKNCENFILESAKPIFKLFISIQFLTFWHCSVWLSGLNISEVALHNRFISKSLSISKFSQFWAIRLEFICVKITQKMDNASKFFENLFLTIFFPIETVFRVIRIWNEHLHRFIIKGKKFRFRRRLNFQSHNFLCVFLLSNGKFRLSVVWSHHHHHGIFSQFFHLLEESFFIQQKTIPSIHNQMTLFLLTN